MTSVVCPKCMQSNTVKSGIIKEVQRYLCKKCHYYFTVSKLGKSIDPYYVIKALQLYIEGVPYREIERILGVSHVTVMNWVKRYKIKQPEWIDYKPSYSVLTKRELSEKISEPDFLANSSMIVNELGDKLMVIRWKRIHSV